MTVKMQGMLKKIIGITVLVVVGLFALRFIARLMFFYTFYGPLYQLISATFGDNILLAKILAVMTAILAVMATPWILATVFLGKHRREVFIGLLIVTVLLFGLLYYESEKSFFDSNSGQPVKYYCVTVNGIKFSQSAGVDDESGEEFVLITKDFARQYAIWKKYERGENVSYFDAHTGKPNFKYIKREDGTTKIFPTMYTFDTKTGQKLNDLTEEVAKKLEDSEKDKIIKNVTPEKVKGTIEGFLFPGAANGIPEGATRDQLLKELRKKLKKERNQK